MIKYYSRRAATDRVYKVDYTNNTKELLNSGKSAYIVTLDVYSVFHPECRYKKDLSLLHKEVTNTYNLIELLK